MPTDYEEITQENVRRYGEDTAILDLLRDLYSERTHFLLELLQNAEDAGASWVRFELSAHRLQLRHNGRPFTSSDVVGICGVAKGTKANDITQIGTFGIGFKSVYAYTNSPEIYSGAERFVISHYVRPRAASSRTDIGDNETLFVFPFDRPTIDPGEASTEILDGFRNLGVRTLLFLRSINRIEWSAGHESGSYDRTTEVFGVGHRVGIVSKQNGEDVDVEDWLVFQRSVNRNESDFHRVEVAFRLKVTTKGDLSIQPIRDSRLVVFFPTETETHLGFLIQGPYQTTPARDNIPKDTEWNIRLVDETCLLLASALPLLRDMGLLSRTLFQALPIIEDDFPEDGMFRPLFEGVREVFGREPLIRAVGGGFIRSGDAKLARGAHLRGLLGEAELTELFGRTRAVRWISEEITADGATEVVRYLRDTLEIDEVTADSFMRRLTDEFLQARSDDWLTAFYRFLTNQRSLWKDWDGSLLKPLADLKFVRLEGDSHGVPLSERGAPTVYLPPVDETEFPIVKRSIAADVVARGFLEEVGLSEPDIVDEVLAFVLPKYQGVGPGDLADEQIERDVTQILHGLGTDSQEKKVRLTGQLRRARWLRCRNAATSELSFQSPSGAYLVTDELQLYFEGNQAIWFLDEVYSRWFDALRALGVTDDVRIELRRAGSRGHVYLVSERGYHVRGLHGFDPDCEIDGLEHALSTVTFRKAKYIWTNLLSSYSNQVRGTVEQSTRQEFDNPERESRWSKMGELVRDRTWLPDESGEYHRPAEMSLSELPKGFESNEELAAALEMRLPPNVEALAAGTGLRADLLRVLMQHTEEVEEFARRLQIAQARESTAEGLDDLPADRPTDRRPAQLGMEAEPGERSGTSTPMGSTRENGSDRTNGRTKRSVDRNAHEPVDSSDRLPVYVSGEASGGGGEWPEVHAQNVALEVAGIRMAMDFERGQGRDPKEMSANHPGYDIESTSPDGSKRVIEVKASLNRWGTRGVALTRTEFQTAIKLGDAYWLYVVDAALRDDARLHRIQDPARRASQFVFDSGWQALGED